MVKLGQLGAVAVVAASALWMGGTASAVDYPPPNPKAGQAVADYLNANLPWLRERLRGRVCCTRMIPE